jgi:acyl-CoA thioesterase-2
MTAISPRQWLGLEATHNPNRWYLPIRPHISVRERFLFGGAGLAAATTALEETTGRPLVWATAQYLDFAPVGEIMDLDVHVSVSGKQTSQARIIGRVGDREIITVIGALGKRDLALDATWPLAPTARPPAECKSREYDYDADSLGKHIDLRFARTTGDDRGGPTGHGPGRVCLWARPPDELQNSAATLSVLGDFVPMGIGTIVSSPVTSNSLDNTLRIMNVDPSEWYLLDIEAAGIRNGFGHGQLRIWDERGNLQAVASQSVVVRNRRPA